MRALLAAASLVLLTPNACQHDEPARWHYTCGDPVCMGYTVKPGIALCPDQGAGGQCSTPDALCDPRDECNRLLVCSVEPPPIVNCPDVQ